MSKKGLLLVVSAPSGCGKGAIMQQFLAHNSNAWLSVSATTRAPRPGEQEGVNYFYRSREQFEEMARLGGFLEHAEFCGNLYGTPRETVEKRRLEGFHVVLEIEVEGAMQVRRSCPDAVLVFIVPPSITVLRKRLTERGTEDAVTIEKRLAQAAREIGEAARYDYILVNDVLEDAVSDLECVVRACALRAQNQAQLLEEVNRL